MLEDRKVVKALNFSNIKVYDNDKQNSSKKS